LEELSINEFDSEDNNNDDNNTEEPRRTRKNYSNKSASYIPQ
jgi:hypothetical protein